MKRAGFTLIEVLACLLVLTLGLTASIALVAFGLQMSRMALAKSIGMATAISVAADIHPLLPTGASLTTSSGTTTGWVNGLWIKRTEVADQPMKRTTWSAVSNKQIDDPAAPTITTELRSVLVTVDVYEGNLGRLICSYQERMLRQGN